MATTEEMIAALQAENAGLHDTLEEECINSRRVCDVSGKKFFLPVDDEHKAKVFSIKVITKGAQQPHLRAFWSATFGFFSCFFSVFAPAALGPYLKKPVNEGGIALDGLSAANAGMTAVGTTIAMRILCGPMCDKFGARRTFVLLLMAATPGIFGLMFITGGGGLILCRGIIGIGLASFVTCQVWCSQMFNKQVVGIANATAGGWGNLGGGVTQLVMPFIMDAMLSVTGNNVSQSWRLCFLVPLAMHFLSSIFIITGQDLPDGNYGYLEKKGVKQKLPGLLVAKIGASNVNAWILTLTYGLCFGIELTMNNKGVAYFSQYYGVAPRTASVLGSCFGLMNLFARSWGGLLSDAMNKKFGMRGRIWAMWAIQTLEGFMCIVLGLVTVGYPNPFDFKNDPKIPGVWVNRELRVDVSYTFNQTIGMVGRCASKQVATCPSPVACVDHAWLDYGGPNMMKVPVPTNDAFIMIRDQDPACISMSAPLALTMLCMILFSCFVQMAEGLTFGIVPYVSRPALGVVSGMVGAGGNFGGVMGSRFIVGPNAPLDDGFIYLGVIIIIGTLSMFGIYFPEHGGMLFPKGMSYNPQLIKPPADLRGADQMKYDDATGGPGGTAKVSAEP